jgi:hypothetical protein
MLRWRLRVNIVEGEREMKPVAAILTAGLAVAACAPYPAPAPPAPVPLIAAWQLTGECALIREEVARQQRIAAYSGVMDTLLVQGAVLMNVSNVLDGLRQRAAIEGCPI